MKLITAATVAMLAFTVAVPRAEAHVVPPPVPANLEVSDRPFLIGHAYGTQNYVCLLGNSGFAWTFFAPQATLFNDEGRQLITHFLSANPDENGTLRATWQHSRDTSAVWAVAVAMATSADSPLVLADAIPWLKLQVVGYEDGPTGGAALSRTTFVQRVNTQGGIAPATAGCSQAADIGKKALVPYTADYVFYR
jgi:hypothetical protein